MTSDDVFFQELNAKVKKIDNTKFECAFFKTETTSDSVEER